MHRHKKYLSLSYIYIISYFFIKIKKDFLFGVREAYIPVALTSGRHYTIRFIVIPQTPVVCYYTKKRSRAVSYSLNEWTLLMLRPTGKIKRTYIRFPTVLPWHRLIELNYYPRSQSPLYYHYTKPV